MHRSQQSIIPENNHWAFCEHQALPDSGVVHIWKTKLGASNQEVATFWPMLSEEEKNRVKHFYFKRDRIYFIKSRGILRNLLGNYLGLDPRAIVFQYTEFGKPFLANHALQFNVSHTSGTGLFAFSSDNLIGVDIEKIKQEVDFKKLVRRFFSKQEAKVILDLDEDRQAKAFFKCWTRKEAFIKAHGEGLNLPLNQFDVSILETEMVRLKSVHWKQEVAEDWSMASFEPGIGWTGAVVVKGKIRALNLYLLAP